MSFLSLDGEEEERGILVLDMITYAGPDPGGKAGHKAEVMHDLVEKSKEGQ